MSLISVSKEDRLINKEDWGVRVKIVSPLTGEVQTKDFLDINVDLKCIQIRYHHKETSEETGFEVIQDRPVVTLNVNSIDSTLLGGLPETESDSIRWAIFIPPQFDENGALEPYIVYRALKTGTLGDLKCFLRLATDEV